MDWKEKGVKHGFRARSFEKNTFWSFNFQNNTNYTILVSYFFFQIQFWYKKLFLVPRWEMRERDCRIPSIKIEKYYWHQIRQPKWSMFVSNGIIWWGEFILGVFISSKFMKKHIWDRFDFLFWIDFGFLGWFIGFLGNERFIMVPKVFLV